MAVEQILSLRQKVLRAGAWSLGGHISSQVIRLASNLVMTRLLVPDMFGVMAIASMVLLGIGLFSDFGTRQSVIQSTRGDDPDFLNTVWVVQIVRGGLICLVALLLCLCLYFAAKSGWFPPNTAYANPELPFVLAFISLTEFISGFQSTRMATASRWLAQRRLTLIETLSQVSGVVAMILWALLDRSIWALAAGGMVAMIVKTVCSHTWMPGEPNRWMWDKTAFHEIFHFGKWLLVSSILGFLLNNGDRLLLGGMVGAETLGIYVIAYFITNSATQAVGKILGSVTFPVLSEMVRTNPGKLAVTYYKFRLPFDIGLLFMSGLLFEAGRYVIYFLYDARYMEAGAMLQVLSLTLIAFRYNVVDQCYLALGKSKLMAAMIAVRSIVLFVFLPVAFKEYQMSGALWAIVASAFSSIPLTIYFKKKLHLLDVRKELIVLPVFLAGIGAGFICERLLS
jgi:O-antigen/teichoic acid export membrane protein